MIKNAEPIGESDFSWRASAKRDCWLAESADGAVTAVPFFISDRREVVEEARRGEVRLYVVWTGQWRSNIFYADTLPEPGTL